MGNDMRARLRVRKRRLLFELVTAAAARRGDPPCKTALFGKSPPECSRVILSCGDARRSAETVRAGSPTEIPGGHYPGTAGDRETVRSAFDGKGAEPPGNQAALRCAESNNLCVACDRRDVPLLHLPARLAGGPRPVLLG